MQEAIAVLDVGKTNKKIVLFDQRLNTLSIIKKAFPAVERNGLFIETPDRVLSWFLDNLKHFSQEYRIRAISVAAHGAEAVFVDENGELTVPPLSYTNSSPASIVEDFYRKFGSRKQLYISTATPEVGDMVNLAKLIHFAQHKFPEQFRNTARILPYPQYFVYKLTGKAVAEPTILGCHTYLLDAQTRKYSSVVDGLGIRKMLPKKISKSWDSPGKLLNHICQNYSLPEDCAVTSGILDSNSSLLPYIISSKNDFVLNSTGTWCVAMRPSKKAELTEDQIGKMIFYNFDVFNNPVKTSIFMGGKEYEAYTKLLDNISSPRKTSEQERSVYSKVLEEADKFILPSVLPGMGIFGAGKGRAVEGGRTINFEDMTKENCPQFFKHRKTADAVLALSLAIQSSVALRHAGYKEGDKIYVEGGFAENKPYLNLLQKLFPRSEGYTVSIPQASSAGAAILALAAIEGKAPDQLDIELNFQSQRVPLDNNLNLDYYLQKYLKLLGNDVQGSVLS
ncbi:L-fuculokinase [Sedimentisphaera cyanobacteriorum]|uniref:L-fuculokinase n=1 Tax=Sedimentisphaera cyanobacteriorum TaxID=1940790 RepID=A0A1Q2HPK5_9BACT|nr:FGGY family carbohydrate kinase [Sedimentisphaera cyanobacteriorum]AQQ09399.1 L-fuculokinase [Sedimentisphaera cyanobacteriorum]